MVHPLTQSRGENQGAWWCTAAGVGMIGSYNRVTGLAHLSVLFGRGVLEWFVLDGREIQSAGLRRLELDCPDRNTGAPVVAK